MEHIECIRALQAEIEAKQLELQKLQSVAFDPEGVWEVTTEGDVEGRTINKIGVFKGNVFDIVKHCARETYYQLSVKRLTKPPINVTHIKQEGKKTVNFNVQDPFIKLFDKKDQLQKLLPVLPDGHSLSDGEYYGAIKLTWE